MDILEKSQLIGLVKAKNHLKSATQGLWDLCVKSFQPGTVIIWRTSGGRYKQRGRVICVNGTGTNPRILSVNEKTDREVDVDFYSIDWNAMHSQAENYQEVKNATSS